MTFSFARGFLAFALLASIIGGGLFVLHPASARPDERGGNESAAAVAVSVSPVTRKDVPLTLASIGTVYPAQTVAIKSRLDSVVSKVMFQDGDTVSAGDILFVLDDRALKADLSEAQANLARDQAQLEYARKKYARYKSLRESNSAISQQEVEDSLASMNSLAATVASDKANIEKIQIQLGYSLVTAPISGRTGTINVTVGNNVKANDTTPLVTINQIRPVLVQMSLPESSFDALRAAIKQGAVPVSARRTGSGSAASGKISYTDNKIDTASGTYVARAVFENPEDSLWPGMMVSVRIDIGTRAGALTVPDVAVQNSPQGPFVYVITDNEARKKDVTVELTSNGETIISGDLKEGDLVAIDGLMNLKDTAKIKIISAPAPAAD